MRKFKVLFRVMCVLLVCCGIISGKNEPCYAADANKTKCKTIGILTSGGDSPGMNSVIHAVVMEAISRGIEVKGIMHGYAGLLREDISNMQAKDVYGIVNKGGTVLYTSRSAEFRTPEGVKKAVEICKKNGIEGLIVVGGDGSFKGARDLSDSGIPCVCIPGTIDNDISSSDYTIGADTAINTAVAMVDKIADTNQSHNRCSVVEVMGRNCGYIALETGISVGATSIIIPEFNFDFEKDVIEKIEKDKAMGRDNFIIIVAEGTGKSKEIAEKIEKRTGIETRLTILGYAQRGGAPSQRDRVIASKMGVYAVNLLSNRKSNRVIVVKDGKIVDFDITEALLVKKDFQSNFSNMLSE